MQIQINTTHAIEGKEDFLEWVNTEVSDQMSRFSNRISRIEVHFSDENGDKGGGLDIRCTMEARLEGREPMAVTHHAATVADALVGANAKLTKSLGRVLDKMSHRKGNTPMSGDNYENMVGKDSEGVDEESAEFSNSN